MNGFSKFLAAIFGLVGLALLCGAAYVVSSELQFRHEAVLAAGKVVALDNTRRTTRPVVEFQDRAGATHRFTGRVGSRPPSYDVGDAVDVRYRSEHPDDARISGFEESWLAATMLAIFGVVFAGVATGVAAFRGRKKRRSA